MRQLLLAIPALYLCAAHLHADETAAEAGRTYQGTLSAGDETDEDGTFVDYYSITVQRGQRLVVTLRSNAFDSWLQLHLPEEQGGVQYNDDINGTTLDSQLAHTFTQAGTYRFGATLTGSRTSGAYSIQFESSGGSPRTSSAPGVTRRVVHEGSLAGGDLTLGEGGEYYDLYVLDCLAGDSIQIWTESSFDTYLIARPTGMEQAEDDDSGAGLNAQLQLTANQSGDLEVVVTSASPGQTGTYRLIIDGATQRGGGLNFRGQLATGDESLSSGEYFDTYEFEAAAGDQLEITMQSTDFDSYVILVPPSGENAENDDAENGASWLHSRLDYSCRSAGTYTLIATSAQPSERGAYSLSVHGSSDSRPGNGASTGDVRTGRLEAGDEVYEDGSFVDFYTLSVEAGQTVSATLSSTDFDSWLQLELPEDQGGALYNDDISNETLDARIVHRFTQAGDYRFGATTRSPGTQGAYTLRFDLGAVGAPTASNSGTEVIGGRLEDGDRTLSTSGEYYDHHLLHCAAGDRIRIYTASQTDTYLIVNAPGLDAQLDDDDSGSGLNAEIEFTARQSGDLEIMVTTASPGQII